MLANTHPRPTKQAALWMLFLGPFFFLVYGFCNWFTAQRDDVGVLVFGWEHLVPFMPWLILPYMSIDAFFAVSVFLCRSEQALKRHVYRIMAAIVISALGFLLFPLRFSFAIPPVEGFNGWLFKALLSFDQPFNQAPSLHISLLMILWVKYAQHLKGWWRMAMHAWFSLIALSVMGVYQHHFIDVLTGFAAGVVCLYAFPEGGWQHRSTHRNMRLARKYGLFALALAGIAFALKGWYWGLLWPATAVGLVALAYLGLGTAIFQKNADGSHPWPARVILLPYRIGSAISAWYYNRSLQPYTLITPTLAVGGIYARKHQQWDAVLDLTTEFSAPPHANYLNLPVMDITVPSAETMHKAMQWLAQQPQDSVICIHCALGLSRSATIAAAWLVYSGQAPDAREAFIKIKLKRPIVWGMTHERLIDEHIRPNPRG